MISPYWVGYLTSPTRDAGAVSPRPPAIRSLDRLCSASGTNPQCKPATEKRAELQGEWGAPKVVVSGHCG